MTAANALLGVHNLYFAYKKGQNVLNGINLDLCANQATGLLGANGSGKTTLFRCLTGLEKPLSGSIVWKGQAMTSEKDFWQLRSKTGYLLQNAEDQIIFPGVLEDVSFGPLNLGLSPAKAEDLARACLQKTGLSGFEDRLVQELSGGEKKLAALAGVLAMQPELLLLDEPLNELDNMARSNIMTLLKDLPCAKFIISHDEEFLKGICHKIMRLEGGSLKDA